MLVSLKWLADYVALPLPAKALAERLTLAGVKVGRIIERGTDWDAISVGQVVTVHPHPNADRLLLVTVDLAAAERPTVVCGAPNVAAGQKVAFAQPGARLIDGHSGELAELKPARIRGVDSAGMVCSEKELGLSEDHQGILVLAEDAPVGTPLRQYLGDTIFDIEVTPNRPDLLSIIGVAWEAAAQTHGKVHEPERVYLEAAAATATTRASVMIEDKDLCPRYVAGVIERVKVGPSPRWMQERLLSAGMRPISNVVDITNYVMLEYGQPLHAFDLRKLAGQRIVVRPAARDETIRTLDGVTRTIAPGTIVIADAARPVAIAGVMGGADAEVGSSTTTILLESANFNPVSIRATSTAIGLRTEASLRFEKGLHPELAIVAARRAMKLLVELCGGRAAKGLIDVYPAKRPDTRIVVMRKRIEQVLGTDPTTAQARTALTDLGFGCRWVPPDRYVVRVPFWRTDVTAADDVVEEIARATGYDRIEPEPLKAAASPILRDPLRQLRERVRAAAAAAGLQEVVTYPLTTTEALAAFTTPGELAERPPPRLENPMSSEQVVLRSSLQGSVLASVGANLRWEKGAVAVFESARVYLARQDDLPEEREKLVAAISGRRAGRWGEPLTERFDFYDAKGLLENVLDRCAVRVTFQAAEEPGLLRGRTAALIAGGERVGVVGQVHPRVASRFGVDEPAFVFELDIESLLQATGVEAEVEAPSRFPAVIQDLALVVDADVPAAKVGALLTSSALVVQARLFDVYEGPPLPAGKRSLAYAVHFQARDRTLTDAEVADARGRLTRRLQRELGAELRGEA